MKRVVWKQPISFCVLALLVAGGSACQRMESNTNSNINTNLSVNANTAPAANANTSPTTLSSIVEREPEQYRATLVISAETEGGEKTVGIPTLSAEIMRNGADRRVAFKLPDGSDLIYLEKAGQHIAIMPGRKQYAELTQEATGIQLQKLMTPGQLVARLENVKGVERVGEETIGGRTAEKYRYSSTTNTSSSAGSVNTEAFVFVDKETGLPLRSELFAEASGNVQGVKGAKVVAEMRDISTTIDPAAFEVPTGFTKVQPQQVRQQINAIAQMAGAVLRSIMAGSGPTASPSVAASPAATSVPSP